MTLLVNSFAYFFYTVRKAPKLFFSTSAKNKYSISFCRKRLYKSLQNYLICLGTKSNRTEKHSILN
jgi:hypothetical protein